MSSPIYPTHFAFSNSTFCLAAEKALTILQSRHIPELPTPVPLVLSPYPPTNPPTLLPPPSALPRLVKQLPPEYTDSQLYDLFRPFGALASVHTQTQFGPDAGIVEYWNEEDAIQAEQAMHCAEVEGQNIAVQVYQPRRTTSAEFNVAAPTFVPSGLVYPPYPTQVRQMIDPSHPMMLTISCDSIHLLEAFLIHLCDPQCRHLRLLSMVLDNKYNLHLSLALDHPATVV